MKRRLLSLFRPTSARRETASSAAVPQVGDRPAPSFPVGGSGGWGTAEQDTMGAETELPNPDVLLAAAAGIPPYRTPDTPLFPCQIRQRFANEMPPPVMPGVRTPGDRETWAISPGPAATAEWIGPEGWQAVLLAAGSIAALCPVTAARIKALDDPTAAALLQALPWYPKARTKALRWARQRPEVLAHHLASAHLADLRESPGVGVSGTMALLVSLEAALGCHDREAAWVADTKALASLAGMEVDAAVMTRTRLDGDDAEDLVAPLLTETRHAMSEAYLVDRLETESRTANTGVTEESLHITSADDAHPKKPRSDRQGEILARHDIDDRAPDTQIVRPAVAPAPAADTAVQFLPDASVRSVGIGALLDAALEDAPSERSTLIQGELFPAEPVRCADAATQAAVRNPPPDLSEVADDHYLITARDPRFTELPGVYASLAEWYEAVRSDPTQRAVENYEDFASQLLVRREWTLEDEAQELLEAALLAAKVRDVATWSDALTRRFGLDGQPPQTLDEVGRRVSLTRERVRQVQRKVDLAMPDGPLWAPVGEQVVQLAMSLAPASFDDLQDALLGAGLSRLPWTAGALTSTLSFLRLKLDLVEIEGALLTTGDLQHWEAAVQIMRRVSGSHGTASPDTVMARLHSLGRPAPVTIVRLAMAIAPGVHQLTEGRVWCDHPTGRNRLVNTSLRILTVHTPQTVASMHAGVHRSFTWRASTGGEAESTRDLEVPPLNVLEAFYRSHPAFRVREDGMIDAVELLDPEELGEEKWAMVQVLRSFDPPAADRNSLVDACVEVGINASTASVMLTYAECFEKFGRNVWGLRGVGVSDDVVAALQNGARARQQAFDKGQVTGITLSGRPWMARRMSPDVVRSGVLPGNFHPAVLADSSFTVVDASDGQEMGRLRRSGFFVYGLMRLMGKHRPNVGSSIRLTFYVDDMSVLVELGEDDLLAEPPDLG